MIEARAFLMNEDRFYLFPAFAPTYLLAQGYDANSTEKIDRAIRLLIKANIRRLPDEGCGVASYAHMRLYDEGFSYVSFDGRGRHRPCLSIYKEHLKDLGLTINACRELIFSVNGLPVSFELRETNYAIDLDGELLSNHQLIGALQRDKFLAPSKVEISYRGKEILLNDFFKKNA